MWTSNSETVNNDPVLKTLSNHMKFDTLFTENILHQVNNLTHFCKRMGPVFPMNFVYYV